MPVFPKRPERQEKDLQGHPKRKNSHLLLCPCFKECLTVLDDDTLARNELRTTSYYQVNYFRAGLKRSIGSCVATSKHRPSDDDLDGWKAKAKAYDENDHESNAFYHQSLLPAPVRTGGVSHSGPYFPKYKGNPARGGRMITQV
ncbi:hypothetical protein E1B28_005930 [Marasmius oreades]|uniref:Uncharacterized protein n=1 Tax=Marasmius oreades TaxID=181124 RepID=A0A9P7S5M7_9AGAR|nr:uncharacterized protein E1B28_005930 [Marasmius oreades]KAG7095151.1 hypothetical protein E1B28_005930 [Marasmius oreades]